MRARPDTKGFVLVSASAVCGVAITAHFFLAETWLAAAGFGACTVAALVELTRRARALRLTRSLGLELTPTQRGRTVEVAVAIDPTASVELTSVRLTLRCERFEQPAGSEFGIVEPLFTREQSLFDGARRLGHGERFEAGTAFELPPRPEGRSIHTALELRVGLIGQPPLEHRQPVSLDW